MNVRPGTFWKIACAVAASVSMSACSAEPPKQAAAVPPAQVAPAPAAAPATPAAQHPAAESAVPFSEPPAAYNGMLPPFPTSSFAPARPPEVVQAVYTFAARHPEVLHYVPCFCGCQRSGHRDNDDCFISGREADGKPRWEPHGMT